MLTGLGGSVLVHALILCLALIGPFTISKKTVENPFWTVNLVTMQDIGLGKDAPPKGTSVQGPGAAKGEDSPKPSSSGRARTGPLVPVKRLQVDDVLAKTDTVIKKMDASEAPKFSTNTQSAAAVEKNLEKMINKPKTPERPPAASSSKEGSEKTVSAASGTAQKNVNVQDGSGSAQKGEKAATGARQGSARGDEKGGGQQGGQQGAQQGGPPGNTDGAQVGLARRLYYTEIWNAIRRQWALPEFLKSQHLETVLVVVVRRDGKVLDLRVEKSSGNEVYDESARRAVRKAEPLPPFPAIYSPPQEEIGLRFRPEDLS